MRLKVTTSLLATSLLVVNAGLATAFDQWPDTGQTACYDSTGTEVNCDGSEGHAGQDGSYSGPVRDYDTTTETGTVIDTVTKLQWDNPSPPQAAPMTYTQAEAYVTALNTGAHNDWRIPTAQEMATLIDASIQPWDHTSGAYGDLVMPTNTSFSTYNDAVYWTQTDSPNNHGNMMVVRFKQGIVNDAVGAPDGGPELDDNEAYVRPVRDVTP